MAVEPSTLFRVNCAATRMVAEYLRLKGDMFLQTVLMPTIVKLSKDGGTNEVSHTLMRE
jgi:hypothetical protein